jgi:hypothetical protein
MSESRIVGLGCLGWVLGVLSFAPQEGDSSHADEKCRRRLGHGFQFHGEGAARCPSEVLTAEANREIL